MKIQHGGGGGPLPDFTHNYDAAGAVVTLVTQKSGGSDTQSFSYDHLGRRPSGLHRQGLSGINQKLIGPLVKANDRLPRFVRLGIGGLAHRPCAR
ncbi:MAG: hypothetical protein ACRDHL_02210 [Candidatus Promineifilaceae bacterium]